MKYNTGMHRFWGVIARVTFALALVMTSLFVTTRAIGNEQTERVAATVRDKPLAEFLAEIAGQSGRPVVLNAEQIKGNVNGRFEGRWRDVLNTVTASFGLIWYYDGSAVYVYPSSEMESRQLSLSSGRFDRLNTVLTQMDAADKRWKLLWLSEEREVVVSGPPRFVQIVSSVVEAIEQTPQGAGPDRTTPLEVRVFKLKHAWAADTTITHKGTAVAYPGVASVVKEIMLGEGSSGRNRIGQSNPSVGLPNLADMFESSKGSGVGGKSDNNKSGKSRDSRGGSALFSDPLAANARSAVAGTSAATIQADGRINAVIVRDKRSRMDEYASLINALDVANPLIEIEAAVVDIDSDTSERLGLKWQAGRKDSLSFSTGPLTSSNSNNTSGTAGTTAQNSVDGLRLGLDLAAAASPLSMALVAASKSRFFIAQLDALVEEGSAKVVTRPRVVTTSNTEATLSSSESIYVRVAGRDAVNLFPISAGLMLKVVPSVTVEDGKTLVRMLINVEDGLISSSRFVDQIPSVTRKEVSTSAVVLDGESVLVGGYSVENTSGLVERVPVASAIPIFGNLFKRTSQQSSKAERTFVITARVIKP
jgi:type III secretion protein C